MLLPSTRISLDMPLAVADGLKILPVLARFPDLPRTSGCL